MRGLEGGGKSRRASSRRRHAESGRPSVNAEGWQARALSWLLAILATLAIVGAVATMSTNGSGAIADRSDVGTPVISTDPRSGDPVSAEAAAPFTTGAAREPTIVEATLREADALRDVAGWLAALTYAVLALVALAAVGVLALFRIGRPPER